jgi:hypothetical protein
LTVIGQMGRVQEPGQVLMRRALVDALRIDASTSGCGGQAGCGCGGQHR